MKHNFTQIVPKFRLVHTGFACSNLPQFLLNSIIFLLLSSSTLLITPACVWVAHAGVVCQAGAFRFKALLAHFKTACFKQIWLPCYAMSICSSLTSLQSLCSWKVFLFTGIPRSKALRCCECRAVQRVNISITIEHSNLSINLLLISQLISNPNYLTINPQPNAMRYCYIYCGIN